MIFLPSVGQVAKAQEYSKFSSLGHCLTYQHNSDSDIFLVRTPSSDSTYDPSNLHPILSINTLSSYHITYFLYDHLISIKYIPNLLHPIPTRSMCIYQNHCTNWFSYQYQFFLKQTITSSYHFIYVHYFSLLLYVLLIYGLYWY